ncbi:glycosyltransferase family 4 protein, partial [Planctomycetota bacterium]
MGAKILLLFEYGTLNGGEFSLLSMLQWLGKKPFEFVAAVPSEGMLRVRLNEMDIPTLPLMLRDAQGQKLPLAPIWVHLHDLVNQTGPDLVHANSLSMGRMLGRVASRLPMPSTTHLRDIMKLNRSTIADLSQHAGLIAVSHATRQFHVAQGMQSDKVQVIHNGVDTDLFRPGTGTGALKSSLGLCDNDLLVTNIGQICLRKGQMLLAQAAVSLAQTWPQMHYAFVGERYSQKQESIDYEKSIRRLFQEAGIEDRLHRLGFRSDIPQILNETDLLVHTAHQEPLGRVLLEAASCATPIVVTDVGGTAEILTDRTSALLIPPDDLEALCAAIK